MISLSLFLFFPCLFSFLLCFYDTHPASRSIMNTTSFLFLIIIHMFTNFTLFESAKSHVRVQRRSLQIGSASHSKWYRQCCFCKTSCSYQNVQDSLVACRLRVAVFTQTLSLTNRVFIKECHAFLIVCTGRYFHESRARFGCNCGS